MTNKLIIEEFKKSLETGFIDKLSVSEKFYQPELLVNQKTPPKKVLSTIIQELLNCEDFFISVAFVTSSGVATLINTFKMLEERKVKGKILVSQYLNFTEPEALKKLSKFNNIELKISIKENAHSKGYIFKTSEYYNLIIGSSNLTANALSTNKEWNLKVSALNTSSIVEKVIGEFNSDFEKGVKVTKDYITNYEGTYNKQLLFNQRHSDKQLHDSITKIEPNPMQEEALINLIKLRKEGKNKALLISATGTGKTYLSAFDAQSFNAKRLLFVVHRRIIAEKSLKTFKNIFGDAKSMGLFSGDERQLDKDFVFSTIQTISKQDHLNQFGKQHFDYIIIDESHRSGAMSYRRLIDYFNPAFLLGMTATPERTDGDDIFSLFDHNIAYEIRLNRAMEENMLSQFHYYGVTDLLIDNKKHEDIRDFNRLISDDRVEKIISNADFYGSDNGITRGLVFCSRNKEAQELSVKFNVNGFKTIALSGDSSEKERTDAIDRLESDNPNERLDYIFTVDIFNEGVDIPKVNQILMIRPTDSAIIFVQQLGRGLRKIESKGYLTVIDFIGNYKNNYLIPIALYGDTSYNKDLLRKMISSGSQMIPGASTINFDKITKERIFKSIDSANMQLLVDLRKDYNLLKYKLGRIPMMMDFIEHGSRDPFLFVEYSRSYYNFLKKVDKDYILTIKEKSQKLLELFSKEINNSKRVEESIILFNVIEKGIYSNEELRELINIKYGYIVSNDSIDSCAFNINFEFIRENKDQKLLSVQDIYNIKVLKYEYGKFTLFYEFKSLLNQFEFKHHLLDSIKYSIYSFDKNFELEKWRDGFVLYRKYSRKDVFRILNVSVNPNPQTVGGYLVDPDNKHCPIFVNYHKEDNISESTKYEDEFVNNKEFDWMSKSKRTLNSPDVKSILGSKGNIRLPLFIKKNNDEGSDFYYMGDVTPKLDKVEQTTMLNDKKNKISVVKIRFILTDPVSEVMFQYIQENTDIERKNYNIKKDSDNIIDFEYEKDVILAENLIPLYDFYAAAGSFSEMQSNQEYTLINIPEKYKSNQDYFACKVIGESMNRRIPNGSTCLFQKYTGGSRGGKIVLVENFGKTDIDYNSSFTIKTYSSEKRVYEDHWEHTAIVLKPNSYDKTYKDIVIKEDTSLEMRIVGVFLEVLW